LTQAALAESMHVTPRNVTGLVDGLVETGFVTPEPHPTDRRATLVSLTTKGRSVVAGFQKGHGELAEPGATHRPRGLRIASVPPSTTSVEPTNSDAASESRNAIASATSSGRPARSSADG
jgi:DNA-binding MarR family transcriptional regulator